MEPLKLIKYALDTSIALINQGSQPTSALEKTARELDLNPNYIQRVGEALNVALHYNHFNKSAAANRADDFAVADIPTVTKTIFGEKEKTAAQKHSEWFGKQAEEIDYNKVLTHKGFKKQAEEIKNTDADFDSFDITFKGQYKKAADYISRLEKELDEIRTEKSANDTYLEAVFNATVNHFKKTAASRMAFHDFETKTFADHGERSKEYVDLIYKSAGLTEDRGIHDTGAINFEKSRELDLFDSLLKSASRSIELRDKLAEAEGYVAYNKAVFKHAGMKLHPDALKFEKEAASTLADIFEMMLEKDAFAGGIKESLIMDLYDQLSDAAYDRDKPSVAFKNTKMDNLNKVTMVQELMMTDPILRHQPPQKVLQAYQTMLRMSPHLAADKEVARALLRQLTATQSIAPTEANQWIEANTNLMKQQQMLQGVNPNKKDRK